MIKKSRYAKTDYILPYKNDVIYLNVEFIVTEHSDAGANPTYFIEIKKCQINTDEMSFAAHLISFFDTPTLAALHATLLGLVTESELDNLHNLFYAGDIISNE